MENYIFRTDFGGGGGVRVRVDCDVSCGVDGLCNGTETGSLILFTMVATVANFSVFAGLNMSSNFLNLMRFPFILSSAGLVGSHMCVSHSSETICGVFFVYWPQFMQSHKWEAILVTSILQMSSSKQLE